jgi:metal-responsive CopG/Arc/MetJ family transcriptional regulator
MATDLKRVNVMLDEPLVRQLKDEARQEQTSLSALLRRLARDYVERKAEPLETVAERIRRRRESLPRTPDSTETLRGLRERPR